MQLHQLKPKKGSRPPKRIVGRGEGSTLGQTCGKGQKGQTCRAGDTIMNGFEGGQMPLVRRVPKRGFNHPSKIHYFPINIQLLEEKFKAGDEVNAEVLSKAGFLPNAKSPFKVLGAGKISKALKISASRCSKSAEAAVKKAGGAVTLVK